MKGRGVLALGCPSDTPIKSRGVSALEKPFDIIHKGEGDSGEEPLRCPLSGGSLLWGAPPTLLVKGRGQPCFMELLVKGRGITDVGAPQTPPHLSPRKVGDAAVSSPQASPQSRSAGSSPTLSPQK